MTSLAAIVEALPKTEGLDFRLSTYNGGKTWTAEYRAYPLGQGYEIVIADTAAAAIEELVGRLTPTDPDIDDLI